MTASATIVSLRELYSTAVARSGKLIVLAELFKLGVRHVGQLDNPGDREPELRALLLRLADAPAAETPAAETPAAETPAAETPAAAALAVPVAAATPATPAAAAEAPAAMGPAEALWVKGYDVVAIRAGEKRPFEKNWTKRPRLDRATAQRLDRERHSVGIRTGSAPGCIVPVVGLDTDVTDAALAADLIAHALDHFGPAPRRTGRPPKALLVYRADEPLRKHRLAFTVAGTEHAIELLATGQQFVASGIHPDTQRPYSWDHPLPPANELTPITSEQVRDYFETALPGWLKARGIEVTASRAQAADRANVDQLALRAPSIDALSELVRAIENDTDYDTWVADLAAIKAAAGPEHDAEAFEIAWEYSERWVGGADLEELREKWASLQPPFALGWSYLLDRARRQGINTALLEFAPVQPSPPVTELSETEQAAALLGIASLPLAFEAASLNGDFPARRRALQAAAAMQHPDHDFFRNTVLNRALRLPAHSLDKFDLLLDSVLSDEPAWRSRSPANRRLLARSAFMAVAPFGSLLNHGSSEAVPVLTDTDAPRTWLLDGILPQGGLGAIVGPPGSGKSFVAVDLAVQVATGGSFLGRTIPAGPVLYFASEDGYGIAARLKAAHPESSNIHVIGRALPLGSPEQAFKVVDAALAATSAEAVRLIVIDVLRDSLSGDQNSPEVMAAAMATANLIARQTGAAILMLHHTPRSDTTRPSGSINFDAAMDWWASVESRDGTIKLVSRKLKHGPLAASLNAAWHIEAGRLLPGPTRPQGNGMSVQEMAVELACLLHDCAIPGVSMTRTQITDLARAERPHLFGEDLGSLLSRVRIHRALQAAIREGWIVMKGKSFIPGERPPLLAPVQEVS